MNRARRLASLAAALALLSSCSVTKLAYNRLDWLASWEVGKYIELEGPSEQLFKSGFAELWRWHRGTQLAAYARDLRELAQAVQGPMADAQIRDYVQRVSDHGDRLFEQALPPMTHVLRALDDAQVGGLLAKLSEERRELAEDVAGRTPEEARDESIRNVSRGLRRWLGGVSDAQKALVRDWAAARRTDEALWQRYGEQWEKQFGQTLASRVEPGFDARLRTSLVESQLPDSAAIEEFNAHNRENFIRLLVQLAPTLSEKQRHHLGDRLTGYAEDLEELAAEGLAAEAARAGSIG